MIIFSGSPINAVQLLWINLLTDCAPAISLSMERAEDSVMKRRPYTAIGKLFDGAAVISLAVQSIFIAAVTLIAYAVGSDYGSSAALTMAFAVLGMSQIFHCYNNKLEGSLISRRIFSNRFMNLSAILALFIIIFLVFTPAGFVFGMTVLTVGQFAVCLLLSVLVLPLCELIKLIKRLTVK